MLSTCNTYWRYDVKSDSPLACLFMAVPGIPGSSHLVPPTNSNFGSTVVYFLWVSPPASWFIASPKTTEQWHQCSLVQDRNQHSFLQLLAEELWTILKYSISFHLLLQQNPLGFLLSTKDMNILNVLFDSVWQLHTNKISNFKSVSFSTFVTTYILPVYLLFVLNMSTNSFIGRLGWKSRRCKPLKGSKLCIGLESS